MSFNAKPTVTRWVGTQLLFLAVLAAIAALFRAENGISVLFGGLSSLMPNAYFAFRFFARWHETRPRRVLTAFYMNELIKIICAAGLLVLVAVQPGIRLLPLVVGFLTMSLAQSVLARVAAFRRREERL